MNIDENDEDEEEDDNYLLLNFRWRSQSKL